MRLQRNQIESRVSTAYWSAAGAARRGRLFGAFDLNNEMTMYAFVLVVVAAAFFLIYRIINSPFGEVLKAIRENEQRSISLGYRTDRYKLIAFVLSATLAGLAGSMKAIVFQLASLTDVHWTMSGEVILMTLVGGSRHHLRPGGRGLHYCRDGELSGAVRPMGAGDPGRDLRRLRAGVPARHHRRAGKSVAREALGPASLRAKRSNPVLRYRSGLLRRGACHRAGHFGPDPLVPRNDEPRRINFARCYPQTKSQQIVRVVATFIFIAESTNTALFIRKRRFQRRFLTSRFWLLRHVGTAIRSVRQYRAPMARTDRASAGAFPRFVRHRALAALLHRSRVPRRNAQSIARARPMGGDRRHSARRATNRRRTMAMRRRPRGYSRPACRPRFGLTRFRARDALSTDLNRTQKAR